MLLVPTTASLVEVVYYASAPVVALLAAIGLRQISVAKRDIRLRADRALAETTAGVCDLLAEELIPDLHSLHMQIEALGVDLPRTARRAPHRRQSLSDSDVEMATRVRGDDTVHPEAVRCINRLNSVAFRFTSGIADEQMAFPLIGGVYCHYVRLFYPLIIENRDKWQRDGGFDTHEKLLLLYNCWESRLTTMAEDQDRVWSGPPDPLRESLEGDDVAPMPRIHPDNER